MKKYLNIISLHSVSGLVSNSSSEIYIISGTTQEYIETFLNVLAIPAGHHGVGSIQMLSGVEGIKTLATGELSGWLDLEYLPRLLSTFIDYKEIDNLNIPKKKEIEYNTTKKETAKSRWDRIDKVRKENEDLFNKTLNNLPTSITDKIGSFIVLVSESDNSIPYSIMETIENTFPNSYRQHLG